MSEEIKKYLQPGKNNIVFIYLLFLGGLMFPILSFLGGVFAYVNKSNHNKVLQTHYLFAFNTFFICVINFILSLMINFVFIVPLLFTEVSVPVISKPPTKLISRITAASTCKLPLMLIEATAVFVIFVPV